MPPSRRRGGGAVMSDLITCLRGMGLPLTENAADEIDRLESEIDRLTRELAEAKARAVPDSKSVATALKEAAEILSAVADENLNDLPANWRWPLIDELSGLAAMLSARPESPHNCLPSKECPTCYADGVYDTDGNGPMDCYTCGKKAARKEPSDVE